MTMTTLGKNKCLNALGVTTASLHTGAPGTNGANEITGGSYARKAISFNAAASGAIDSSNQPVFDIPGGNTVSHYALWDGSGDCMDAGALPASESFTGDGTYTLLDADIDLNG